MNLGRCWRCRCRCWAVELRRPVVHYKAQRAPINNLLLVHCCLLPINRWSRPHKWLLRLTEFLLTLFAQKKALPMSDRNNHHRSTVARIGKCERLFKVNRNTSKANKPREVGASQPQLSLLSPPQSVYVYLWSYKFRFFTTFYKSNQTQTSPCQSAVVVPIAKRHICVAVVSILEHRVPLYLRQATGNS